MSSLRELIIQHEDIEQNIIDNYGEITQELSLMWQETNLQLSKKVDNYGKFLDIIAFEKLRLKQQIERRKLLYNQFENLDSEIKHQLYSYAKAIPLIGEDYKFIPYISKHRIVEADKVEPEFIRVTVQMSKSEYSQLTALEAKPKINMLLKKEEILVSELPEYHPALKYELEETVKVSKPTQKDLLNIRRSK